MAKTNFLTDLDLNGNQLLNVTIQNLATAPASPKNGQIYYNTTSNTTMQWNGTGWINLADIYVHPTQTAISVANANATVLNGITVNTLGHVTATSSTTLTPAIIGSPTNTGTGASGTWSISVSGSAATLTTPRSIFGNSFNGSADITGALSSVTSITGTGAATMASFLGTSLDSATAPSHSFSGDTNTGMYSGGADLLGFTTGGVARLNISTTAITSSLPITATIFNGAGTGLTGTATTLNIGGTAAKATILATARTLWGQSFDGSANVTGALTSVTDISMTGTLSGAIDIRVPQAKAGSANAGSLWIGTGATSGSVSASMLSGMSDVLISSPVSGNALVWDGTRWTNQASTSINDNTQSTTQTWSSSKITTVVADINSTITGGLVNKGAFDASANSPLLNSATPVAGIKNGWTYVVTVAGTFFTTETLSVGDMLIAKQDNPTALAHWTVVNKNIPDIVTASTSAQGIVQLATGTEAIAGTDTGKAVTPAALQAKVATATAIGLIEIADQTETNAGTDNTRAITPLTMKTYVTGYVGGYSATFGNGVLTAFDITHNLGTLDIEVQVVEVSTNETVYMQVRRTTVNSVNIQCNGTAPTAGQYKVIIKK
jgi:hypothetical protein